MRKRTFYTLVAVALTLIVAASGAAYMLFWREPDIIPVEDKREYFYDNDVLFRYIYANSNGNFAISTDGELFVWGSNMTGVLGLGDTEDRALPEAIGGFNATDVVKVSSGVSYSLVLMRDGRLFGWGYKSELLLGLTDFPVLSPKEMSIDLDGEKIVDIAAGQDHVLALTESGRLFVWGEGNFVNIGNGRIYFNTEGPIELERFSEGRIVQIEVDTFTNAVVTDLGEVFIWGRDEYRDNVVFYVNEPTRMEEFEDIHVARISLGRSIAVLSDDGRLYTLGRNLVGELGVGDMEARFTPQEVVLAEDDAVRHIDSGSGHMMAVTDSGRVFSWGYNNKGQVGDPTGVSGIEDSGPGVGVGAGGNVVVTPYEITSLSEKGIEQVCAGQEYSVVRSANGEMYSWGYGSSGQLGTDNSVDIRTEPVRIDLYAR